MSLHDKIIDIPPSRTDSQGYLIGHRDARHAAAELAVEADAQIAALQAEREALRFDKAVLLSAIDGYNRHIQEAAEADLKRIDAALASSAAAPEQADEQPVLTTCNCRWSGDTQVQQCTLHEAHVQAIHEWAERAKTAEAAAQAQPAPAAEDGPIASIYVTPDGAREVDDWRHPLPVGRNLLYTRPSAPLSEGSHRIDGLGRMTDDDDGFVTLQFVSEAAAEAFMARYEPTVDVDAMPSPAPQQTGETTAAPLSEELTEAIGLCVCDVINAPGMNSITTPDYAVRVAAWLDGVVLAAPLSEPTAEGVTKEALADLIRTAGHVTRSHAKMIADVLHAALSSPASSAGMEAQRLDWIEQTQCDVEPHYDQPLNAVQQEYRITVRDGGARGKVICTASALTIREAIDAAMAATPPTDAAIASKVQP